MCQLPFLKTDCIDRIQNDSHKTLWLIENFDVYNFCFDMQMISLYKDPKGENIFTKNDTPRLSQTGSDQKMVINGYKKRIKELECQLSENKVWKYTTCEHSL